jgi:chromosome segregation ATPase
MNAAETVRLVNDYEMNRMALSQRLRESETARTTLGRNFEELNEAKQQLDTAAMSAAEEVGASREQILRLREKVRLKSKKIHTGQDEIRELRNEVARLKFEMEHKDQRMEELTRANGELKVELRDFKRIEAEVRETKVKCDGRDREVEQLKQNVEHLQKAADANRATAENELKGRRQAEAKLFEVSSQLSEITLKFHDQELAAGESEKERQRLDAEMKKRSERLAATEEANRTLRERVSELEADLKVLSKHSRTQKQELTVMRQKVTELEGICHDHTTLYQFIHKITERSVAFADSGPEDG